MDTFTIAFISGIGLIIVGAVVVMILSYEDDPDED